MTRSIDGSGHGGDRGRSRLDSSVSQVIAKWVPAGPWPVSVRICFFIPGNVDSTLVNTGGTRGSSRGAMAPGMGRSAFVTEREDA